MAKVTTPTFVTAISPIAIVSIEKQYAKLKVVVDELKAHTKKKQKLQRKLDN